MPHLLLVSEDERNAQALAHAERHLRNGHLVTWICSTPTSQDLDVLEAAYGLKNVHMGALNLLVVTRHEKQVFDVLTGALDGQHIRHCAGLLFDANTVTDMALALLPGRETELLDVIADQLPHIEEPQIQILTPESGIAESAAAAKKAGANQESSRVAVTVILQGREKKFEMAQTAGTLLEGAEDAGIDLPFSCRGGVCSTCRTKLIAGAVELAENYALDDWEIEAGFTLPCQASPLSSEITLNYDDV